jgi:glutaredoxin-like protein
MPLLPDDVQQQVKKAFAEMLEPVKLVHFTSAKAGAETDSMLSPARELVEEVGALSGKLEVKIVDIDSDPQTAQQYGVDKMPATLILRGGKDEKDYGIRFYGIPSGYEFTTLIEDILLVSRGEPRLSIATLAKLAKLDRPVHIQVFVTPTCGYCPQAVVLAHQLAFSSDLVTADAVESMEFPELANRYQVYGVPRTVINEVIHIEGAVPEHGLMDEFMKVMDDAAMGELAAEWAAEA